MSRLKCFDLSNLFWRLAVPLSLLPAAALLVFGQAGSTARLTGQVTDTTGAIMPKVAITLDDASTGAARTTVTNEQGYYSLDYLPPGSYRLTAKSAGFSEVVIDPVELRVAQVANINVTLKAGNVTEQVTVSASAVALETQNSSLGGVVSEQTVRQLPLLLRDPTQLVTLVPGVTADHRFEGGGTELGGVSYQGRLAFSINGGFRSQAISMVDGVDITVSAGSFLSNPIAPTADFTQEFKVQTNNMSAEYGRGAGVLNVVTKSGTNSFHGSAFEFLQNDNLNANNFFSNRAGQPLPELKRNQFGGTVGGPIWKDKTFFFANAEFLRQRRFLPIAVRVPTDNERGGDFSSIYTLNGAPITIFNPFDTFTDTDGRVKRRPFAGNRVPSNMINPFAKNILQYYPTPNNPGLLAPGNLFTGTGNYTVGSGAPSDYDRFDVKIDHNLGSKHRLMGRYSQSEYTVAAADVFNNVASSQSLSSRNNFQPGHNVVLSWTWTPTPTLVITQAGNWARIVDDSTAQSQGFDPSSLGGPYADGRIVQYANQYTGGPLFPNITPSGYAPTGDGFGNTFTQPYSNYQYSLGIAKSLGKHTVKGGMQYVVLQAGENLRKGFGGSFSFGGGFSCGPDPLICTPFTGNGMADMLMGLPSGGSMSAGFTSLYSSKYIGFYVQDDFRVTRRLTLNLGLRYDVNTPFTERFDHMFRFDPERANPIGNAIGANTGGKSLDQYYNDLTGRPLYGSVVFPSTPGVDGRGIINTDKTNFAPRIGAAYQVTDKFVLRGGFSKLYMLSPVAPGPSTPNNGPYGALTSIIATTDGIRPNVTIDNPFPNGFNVPIYDTKGMSSLLGEQLLAGATKGKTPYQWQWNFGFQYELPGNMIFSAAYAGTRGHRLTCAFFYCGDNIPREMMAKYGSKLLDTVPNPFYGIITNPLAPLSQPNVQFGQLLRRWPQYNGVVPILPAYQGLAADTNTFNAAYDALQVEVNKRFSQGLTFTLAYTWSKNLTNTDSFESGYLGPAVGYQDNWNYQLEKSYSAADVPQRVSIGYVYDLPFGKGKAIGQNVSKPVDMMIGGWQLAGITTFASGYPVGISQTGQTTGAFGGGNRPDWVGNACGNMDRSRGEKIVQYLDPTGFQRNANFTFGNAPRTIGSCRSDGIKNFDISVIKFIPIWERVNAELRGEFFNAFNRVRLGNPNTTFGSGSFGAITGQRNAPRVIQIGLKINF
jgi:hypothetical protein